MGFHTYVCEFSGLRIRSCAISQAICSSGGSRWIRGLGRDGGRQRGLGRGACKPMRVLQSSECERAGEKIDRGACAPTGTCVPTMCMHLIFCIFRIQLSLSRGRHGEGLRAAQWSPTDSLADPPDPPGDSTSCVCVFSNPVIPLHDSLTGQGPTRIFL